MNTTLRKILEHSPCERGWRTLVSGLGRNLASNDAALSIATIRSICGVEDAIWALKTLDSMNPDDRLVVSSGFVASSRSLHKLPSLHNSGIRERAKIILWMCDVCELSLPIFEAYKQHDLRPKRLIEKMRDYAEGRRTQPEVEDAYKEVRAANREIAKEITFARSSSLFVDDVKLAQLAKLVVDATINAACLWPLAAAYCVVDCLLDRRQVPEDCGKLRDFYVWENGGFVLLKADAVDARHEILWKKIDALFCERLLK